MSAKSTISTIFLVPTLKIPKEDLISNGFLNGYFRENNLEHYYEDCVYLLFKPDNVSKFREFLEREYERTKNIIEDYDHDCYTVVVYKLDSKYKEDFNLVYNGKYSQTSNEFQKLFPAAVKIIRDGLHKDEMSLQLRIFKKTPDLQEFWIDKLAMTNPINKWKEEYEVWETWDETTETLNFNKLKELV